MPTAYRIFNDSLQSYGYDDLIILPNSGAQDKFGFGVVDFTVDDVNLKTRVSTNIEINLPIVSSPMDTVTGADMAIHLALQGGIGVIHCNQSIADQAETVLKVKRYHNGFINYPITFGPDNTAKDIIDAQKEYGFSGFPIVDGDGNLLGLVSRKEIDMLDNPEKIKVSDIMITTLETAPDGLKLEEYAEIIKQKKMSRLPIVDDGKLVKLVCRKDVRVLKEYPLATLHPETRQLMVGAAVTTHEKDRDRIYNLIEAGVDFLVIDSSNGATQYQINTLVYIKTVAASVCGRNIDVVCGNVVTAKQAAALVKAGADGLRVGMGIGSICTTQNVTGVGRGQASAIYDVVTTVFKMTRIVQRDEFGDIENNPWGGKIIPVIADGGISNSGHIVKALALGASCVMLGYMLAGTDEAPGDYFYRDGVRVKKYRGMGSLEAMKMSGSKARYMSTEGSCIVTHGVAGAVTGKGSLDTYVPTLAKAVRHGFQNIGWKEMLGYEVEFEIRTNTSILDGNVHHIFTYDR